MFDNKLMCTHRVVCNLEGYSSPRRLRAHRSRSLFSFRSSRMNPPIFHRVLNSRLLFVILRKVKSKRSFCSARN